MTLLTIIQDAAVLCNLPEPSSAFNSTDPNVPLLLRLANQEGNELARRHDWARLAVPASAASFSSTATEEQTNFTDFGLAGIAYESANTTNDASVDRLLAELWNTSLTMKYTGPVDETTWQRLHALAITSGTPGWWRIGYSSVVGVNTIYIYPAPTAGEIITFSFVSHQWVITTTTTSGSSDKWTSDTDYGAIPERLMTLGVIWRYKRAKGLDYAEDMATYEREVERACSRDRGPGKLYLSRQYPYADYALPTWPGQVIP
jgi:hypothetical protein